MDPELSLQVGVYAELIVKVVDDEITEEAEQLTIRVPEDGGTYLLDDNASSDRVTITFVYVHITLYSGWLELSKPSTFLPTKLATYGIQNNPSVKYHLYERRIWLPQIEHVSQDWGEPAFIGTTQEAAKLVFSAQTEFTTSAAQSFVAGFSTGLSLETGLSFSASLSQMVEAGQIVPLPVVEVAGEADVKQRVAVFAEAVQLVLMRETTETTGTRTNITFITVAQTTLGYTRNWNSQYRAKSFRVSPDEEDPDAAFYKQEGQAPPLLQVLARAPKPPGSQFGTQSIGLGDGWWEDDEVDSLWT